MFFTIWYGVYNTASRTIRWAGGGHPPAVLFPGGSGAPHSLLDSDGPLIGAVFPVQQLLKRQRCRRRHGRMAILPMHPPQHRRHVPIMQQKRRIRIVRAHSRPPRQFRIGSNFSARSRRCRRRARQSLTTAQMIRNNATAAKAQQ
jgi:hypothetical protein